MQDIDIDPEKRAELLESATLQGEQTINGIKLRPMTWATYSLFHRIKDSATSPTEWSFNMMLFVYLHTVQESKLRANVAKPEALLPEVWDFMAQRGPQDVEPFQSWVQEQIDQFSASTTASDPVGVGINDPKS